MIYVYFFLLSWFSRVNIVIVLLLEPVLITVSKEMNDHEDFPLFHRVLFH